MANTCTVHTTWFDLKFLLGCLECYKDTQMKAYDIIKLTAEMKSDNVQYRNKILPCCFFWLAAIYMQVTFRFRN